METVNNTATVTINRQQEIASLKADGVDFFAMWSP